MKKPTKAKPTVSATDADDKDVALVEPPPGAIKELEKHACLDLRIARLTLGLYEAIYHGEPQRLFPGYHWELRDLHQFPTELREPAQRLLAWGQERCAWLNELVESKTRIEASVYSRRECSPLGRKWIAIAERIRRKHPVRKQTSAPDRSNTSTPVALSLLPEMIGLPLTDRTLRLVQSFNPATIQVQVHDAYFLGSIPRDKVTVSIRLNPDRYSVQSIVMMGSVPRPKTRPKRIEGELEDYFETGTEGVLWALQDDDNLGYAGLHLLAEGDHLEITDQLGHKLWSGVIRCDRQAGRRAHPLNPKFNQPSALGCWVHWTQQGFKPDDWAGYFIRPGYDRLRGVLIKKAANDHATTNTKP